MSRSSAVQGSSPPDFLKMARLITAHQIGMVFDSASGKRLPRLVESTMIALSVAHLSI